jgi:hypothetical protein
MQVDNLSRALLALILVCLLLLLLGLGRSGGSAAVAPPPAASAKHFITHGVKLNRTPPRLIRMNTATGQAWEMGLLDRALWKPLPEGPEGVPSPDATEPGRYVFVAVSQPRGAPTLVRTDHATGRVWRKGSTSKGPWVLVPNPGEEPPFGAGAEEEPAPEVEEAAAPDAP